MNAAHYAKVAGGAGKLFGSLKTLGAKALSGIGPAITSLGLTRGEKLAGGWLAGRIIGGANWTAVAGAAATSPWVRKAVSGAAKVAYRGVLKPGIRHPVWAGAMVTGAAMAMGLRGAPFSAGYRRLLFGSPQRAATGPAVNGAGYVSWTSGRSGGLSPNHLGATGGLTLAMHNTRHRITPKQVNFA